MWHADGGGVCGEPCGVFPSAEYGEGSQTTYSRRHTLEFSEAECDHPSIKQGQLVAEINGRMLAYTVMDGCMHGWMDGWMDG